METSIVIPLLNPNEPEALLSAVFVAEGQKVRLGDILCTLETTKSTAEVIAELDGFVIDLRFAAGQIVSAGEVLCRLVESPEVMKAFSDQNGQEVWQETYLGGDVFGELPSGLRITKAALAVAREFHLDLANLPLGPLVTESTVRSSLMIQKTNQLYALPESNFDPTAIIVYGGGGHGKSVIELLRALGSYHILGIVDDGLSKDTEIAGVPVLGGNEVLPGLLVHGVRLAVNAVGGVGNLSERVKVFHRLAEAGFTCPAIVHPTAYIESSARVSPGVQVFPHAYIGSDSSLGYGCIINTGAIVSHDCVIEDYANISPGAILAGGVWVGAGTIIGMGVTINLGVKIGQGARLGNGATVKMDVPENSIVRAGTIWPD